MLGLFDPARFPAQSRGLSPRSLPVLDSRHSSGAAPAPPSAPRDSPPARPRTPHAKPRPPTGPIRGLAEPRPGPRRLRANGVGLASQSTCGRRRPAASASSRHNALVRRPLLSRPPDRHDPGLRQVSARGAARGVPGSGSSVLRPAGSACRRGRPLRAAVGRRPRGPGTGPGQWRLLGGWVRRAAQ